MVCPHCRSLNPQDARFCLNCGTALQTNCPNCRASFPPGARFCRICGHPLGGSRAAADAAPAGSDAERRIVTVLFCDVHNSTALAEGLDPEEWADVMNSAFAYLIRPIYKYEGTVARLMGDAILAFFGAPTAHEDDPQRAVRAGLEIVDEIKVYAQRLRHERGLDLNVRVGVNTGLVLVGQIGFSQQVEYTAMGDAVNVAARMEQTARPGTVQVSESTYRLVAPLFRAEPLGPIEVKGKAEPVSAYRVLGLQPLPGRLRGIEGLATPLIGREKEMSALRQALGALRQGRGQIVCLLGEAGLGKSRLVEEVHREWLAEGGPGLWRESYAVSYATSQPYAAFQELLRAMCGVRESDQRELVRERLGCDCVPASTPAEQCQRASRVFAVLLGVEPEKRGLEGESFQRELFQVMHRTWQDWAAVQPTVLVFDDLHWADPASVDLLLHLFQLTDRVPILFLCVFRPDRQAAAWRIKQAAELDYPHRYAEIVLEPLSNVESNNLVDALLNVADLPQALRDQVLLKAEGNPFFVEEVIRSLIEAGAVARDPGGLHWRSVVPVSDISIPGSLQALLMARLDRLDEQARHLVQLAAVIGRSFHFRVLEALSDGTIDLEAALQVLQRADLVREAARVPELEYTFRHALTQEAAYRSIARRRRRDYHRRVGEAVESLFPDRRDELSPRLAHHFYEADDARALAYYLHAGDMALRFYAIDDTVAHFDRALEVARWPGIQDPPWKRMYLRRGRALELASRYEAALDNYETMEALGREMGDPTLELAALVAQATIQASPTSVYEPVRARSLCDRALALSRALGDRETEARILWNLLLLHERTGHGAEAVLYGEQSLALAHEFGLREQMAFTLHDLAQAYLDVGQVRHGQEVLYQARELWREFDNRAMLADNLTTSTLFSLFAGDFQQAIRSSEEAFQISQSIGNLWGQAYSRMYVGLAYLERGEFGRALEVMHDCLRLSEEASFVAPFIVTRSDLALAYGYLGAHEQALALIRPALESPPAYMDLWWNWTLIRLAEIHLYAGDVRSAAKSVELVQRSLGDANGLFTPLMWAVRPKLALAQGDYRQVVALAGCYRTMRARGMKGFVPELMCLLGQALLAQGREERACIVLANARTEAEACGSRRALWPILAAQSDLAERRGDGQAARDLRRQAQEIVQFIADHSGAAELRASFLQRPAVKAVLEG